MCPLTRPFLLCLAIIFTLSCSLLPVSDSAKDILFEIKDEFSEDLRFHIDEAPTIKDQKLLAYLHRLSEKICQLYGIQTVPVIVADTTQTQAMLSFSSRTIFISRGMLYAIHNDAEL